MNLKIALLSLLSFSAVTASAMSMPTRANCYFPREIAVEATPVLKMKVGSGLVPTGGVFLREITLLSTGDVTVVEYSRSTNDEEQSVRHETNSLWFESAEVMAKIQSALAQVKKTPLFDTNPKAPTYMDGLFVSVSAKIDGSDFVFAQSSGGHIHLSRNPTQARAAKYLYSTMMELYSAIAHDQNSDQN